METQWGDAIVALLLLSGLLLGASLLGDGEKRSPMCPSSRGCGRGGK